MDDKLITWLNEKLKEKGWSHRELARRVRAAGEKISGGMISAVAAGDKKAGWDFCKAIAKPLDESPEQVFRMAGLLPPLPSSENGPILNEIIEIVKQLPDEEKEDVRDYAKSRQEKQGRKKPPTSPVTTKVPKPAPIIERLPMIPDNIPPETVAKVRALVERLTPNERADVIEYLLSRRDFVEALKLGGVEVQSHRPPEKIQKTSTRKAQE